MPMSATSRFRLEAAPGGLFLVQDLVNTRGIPAYGVRDLLDTVKDAQRWTSTTVASWREVSGATGTVGPLSSADLPGLRRLRADVESLLQGEPADRMAASSSLAVDTSGRVRLQPPGTGTRWLASAVWGEVLLAQRDGQWDRLKVCRNPLCPCAFHDASRNNSRVWHDVRTCGNAANLRASRARRRATTG
jgi:predicted RNA-binding Zn ribbon-like protein